MFKIFRKKSNIGLGLILWALSAASLWAGWRSEVIYTGSNQIFDMVIGDARNDGHHRIYAYMANLGLAELGYLGNGQWSFDIIDIVPSSEFAGDRFQARSQNGISSLILGPGRNDGVNRIYICPYSGPWPVDSLYEYTYSNGDWVKHIEKIPKGGVLLMAPARNDDTLRIYCVTARVDTLYELTWRNGRWDAYGRPSSFSAIYDLIAGKGRNDDTVRLYIDTWPSLVELTYRGEWSVDTLFSVPSQSPFLMAEGRNDSLNRLYGQGATPDSGYLCETTYQDGEWSTMVIDSSSSGYHLSAEVGRNDDTIRLYAHDGGGVWEYTYRKNGWAKDSTGIPSGFLCLGKGRGDDTNRIYVYYSSIIEFSYVSTGIEENKEFSKKTTVEFRVTPNPSSGKATIQYTVLEESPILIRIYDAMGRLVRKFVDGNKIQGKYQIYWDGKDDKGNNVGEGVFFCQLKTGGNTFSKKLIRLK